MRNEAGFGFKYKQTGHCVGVTTLKRENIFLYSKPPSVSMRSSGTSNCCSPPASVFDTYSMLTGPQTASLSRFVVATTLVKLQTKEARYQHKKFTHGCSNGSATWAFDVATGNAGCQYLSSHRSTAFGVSVKTFLQRKQNKEAQSVKSFETSAAKQAAIRGHTSKNDANLSPSFKTGSNGDT